jgi:hypothetical protein
MDKSLTRALAELDKDIMSNVDLEEIDVEMDTDLAIKYKIRTIPALVITNPEREEYHSMVSFYLISEIKNFITKNFANLKRLL